MPRPRKNNADYFSHDTGMRNDEKILALRNKHGHTGYSVWNMFLEILAGKDGFQLDLKTDIQWEVLAGDMRVSESEIKDVLGFCSRIGLITEFEGIYWSGNLIKRLAPMTEKREFMRQKYDKTRVSDTETGVSAAESTQSKVKESKVNTVAKATSHIKIKNESYSMEELQYEDIDQPQRKQTKNPYGKKVMAILAKKYADLTEIKMKATFDASEWSKPLGSMYRHFDKDPQATMDYMERAVKYYRDKDLTFNIHTLSKNKVELDKWLEDEDTKKYNPDLYE